MALKELSSLSTLEDEIPRFDFLFWAPYRSLKTFFLLERSFVRSITANCRLAIDSVCTRHLFPSQNSLKFRTFPLSSHSLEHDRCPFLQAMVVCLRLLTSKFESSKKSIDDSTHRYFPTRPSRCHMSDLNFYNSVSPFSAQRQKSNSKEWGDVKCCF